MGLLLDKKNSFTCGGHATSIFVVLKSLVAKFYWFLYYTLLGRQKRRKHSLANFTKTPFIVTTKCVTLSTFQYGTLKSVCLLCNVAFPILTLIYFSLFSRYLGGNIARSLAFSDNWSMVRLLGLCYFEIAPIILLCFLKQNCWLDIFPLLQGTKLILFTIMQRILNKLCFSTKIFIEVFQN